MRWILALLVMFHVEQASAAALTPWMSLDPPVRNTVPGALTTAKGQGTDSIYAFEVDQTDGAWPVEGVAGGVPIPVTNSSVGPTGSAVPADASYSGMNVGGDLVGLTGTANGLKVDGSAVTQPVSGTFWQATQPVSVAAPVTVQQATAADLNATVTGSVSVSNFPATQAVTQSTSPWVVSGTVTANQGGAPWSMTGTGTPGTQTGGVLTVQGDPSATPLPVSGTVTANAGSGVFTVQQAATSATFQDGSLAFGSLTTSYQTVLVTGGVMANVMMRNNTNGIVVISLNGGTTDSYTLDPGDQISIDLATNGRDIGGGQLLEAKYTGAAPTKGSVRINGVY